MNYLDKALQKINQNRLDAEKIARENKAKALSHPEFAKNYREYISEVIFEAKTGKASGNLDNLKEKIEKCLKNLNISSIEPQYSCPKCQDSGYLDGKQCECLKREINKILTEESGFGGLIDFNNVKYDIFNNSDYMKKVYDKLRAWCNSDFKKNMVYLSGGTGTGKTYLLKCMANELISRGKLTTLVTAYKLSQDCLKSYASRDLQEKDSIIDKYLSSEILFIDDLGTEVNKSSITNSYIYTIINERKMRNLPTIITSNLSLADLSDNYDERITSRIADENTIKIYLEGEDLRLKK